jgi:hypothetical protein
MDQRKITLNVQNKWPGVPDDYVIRFDGHEIGRLRRDSPSGGSDGWSWMLTVTMMLPDWTRGTSTDRDSGLRELAKSWQRLLAETDPQRIERLWELERTAEMRAHKPVR